MGVDGGSLRGEIPGLPEPSPKTLAETGFVGPVRDIWRKGQSRGKPF
jgi:hypothetical protein